jgi:hypothetical protein
MPKKKGKSSPVLTVGIVAVAVLIVLGWTWHSVPGYDVEPGAHVVEKAFYAKQSDIMVEVDGEVVRTIRPMEGNEGHQEFQMRLPNGQLILVVHEHRSGEPAPVTERDRVTVRGNYQWTELGGIIRGTHRDSSMQRRHGWIELEGKRYQ